MSDIVIKAENIGKKYVIGHQAQREKYMSLRDIFMQNAKAFWNKTKDLATGKPIVQGDTTEEVWALRDVSFEVKRGEAVGIIGRNGAGKSTLLKILSRITEPTTGRVAIDGRVASLLEVGTGFHPELSGRENIYLNGTILGMTRAEIRQKFDEIVAFAEVEKYLDTPVKRYSSGMYVRLAFAVAAFLEPEILVIDEVLAVGDGIFQKKCLGKMENISKEKGRTVIFVSHNMQAIRNLCNRAILIDKGEKIVDDDTNKTLYTYNKILRNIEITEEEAIHNQKLRRGGGAIRFTDIEIQDKNGNRRFEFDMGETIRFKMRYKVFQDLEGLIINICLRSGITREFVTSIRHLLTQSRVTTGTTGTAVIELQDVNIRPGEYPLYLHIIEAKPTNVNLDVLDDLTPPIVISSGIDTKYLNFDPSLSVGYFSLQSNLLSNEVFFKKGV
ncbi:MAG: ABC transporter ATP-binding protein [Syntrophaceae bacterium]|nr:ABC transporter ATP-binding protein [Syntrophaceae bacterium]